MFQPLFIPAPPELVIILCLVLLLFGGRKLPNLGNALGRSTKEFEAGREELEQDDER